MFIGEFVVLMAISLLGCHREEPRPVPGDIKVSWQVGTSSCAEAEVTSIAVFVDDEDEASEFGCGDPSGTISSIDPGGHNLELYGRDKDDNNRYFGETGVTVKSDQTTTVPTVQLSALPATLTTTWYFENGRMCGHNGVETVDISLFEDEYLIDSAEADCAEGLHVLEDIKAGSYDVSVLGRDSQGVVTFVGETPVDLDKGDNLEVEVELSAKDE